MQCGRCNVQVGWSLTTSRSRSHTRWRVTSRRFHRSLSSSLLTFLCRSAPLPSSV